MRHFRYLLFGFVIVFIQESCNRNDEGNPDKTVVINEFMAVNTITVADQDGEYDDWIEFFNLADHEIDLTGYYLTESKKNLTRWKFPQGTSITARGYLVVWADKDTTQFGLHANFKLSSLGERVIILSPALEVLDKVEYDAQTKELAYARVPNGTGAFVWQAATFGYNNE